MAALVVAGGAAYWLLAAGHAPPPALDKVVFAPGEVKLFLNRPQQVRRLLIAEPGGEPLVDLRLPEVCRRILPAAFTWRPGAVYDFSLLTPEGWARRREHSPAGGAGRLEVSLLVPYDSLAALKEQEPCRPRAGYRAALLRGSATTCALIMRSNLDKPGLVRGEIWAEGAVELLESGLPPGVSARPASTGTVLAFTRRLSGSGEVHALVFRIKAGQGRGQRLAARVRLESGGDEQQYQRVVALHVMGVREMASKVKVLANRLPASKSGLVDRRAQAQTLYFRPPLFRTLTGWLGVKETARPYWLPYTYQSLTLRNDSRDTLALLIKAKTMALNSDRTPPAFYPPDIFTGTMRDMSVVVSASLLPGERARVAVPLFVTSPPVPGRYRRVLTITSMASSDPLMTLETPLYVRSMNWNAFVFTLAAVGIALAGFVVLAWFFRRLLASLKIRWVVIIALFGSLSFVGVNIPLRVFGSLLHGLLGPFSVLVTGLFNDLLYFSLLVALVRLIPRPGVVTLSILVRYLLGVMITGGFQLIDFVYMGSAMAVKEAALYLAGVTRRREAFAWTWPNMALLAALLALGDAFLNAASLYLSIVLYRLYFADWYIMLHVLVNGFIYTTLAVLLGKRFSDRLVWAEE